MAIRVLFKVLNWLVGLPVPDGIFEQLRQHYLSRLPVHPYTYTGADVGFHLHVLIPGKVVINGNREMQELAQIDGFGILPAANFSET